MFWNFTPEQVKNLDRPVKYLEDYVVKLAIPERHKSLQCARARPMPAHWQ